MKRRRAVLALLIAVLMAMTACSSGADSTTTTAEDGGSTTTTAATGDTTTTTAAPEGPSGALVWDTVFGPTVLDPANMRAAVAGAVATAVYDRLLTFEGADVSEPVPQLASDYTVSDDLQTFTVSLRPEAVFADGTPVTSADVVWSYNRLRNLQGAGAFLMNGLEVTAPDEHTVVITSETPNAGLPVLLTGYNFGVLNSAKAMEMGGLDTEAAAESDTLGEVLDTTSLGSGPYVVSENDGTSRIVITANENYWGDTPAFEQIVLRNVPPEAQLLNIQAGEADLSIDLSPEQAATIQSDSVSVNAFPAIRFFFFHMNQDPAVTDIASNPDFQEAVKYAIDYEAIASLAGPEGQQLAGVVPAIVPGSLPADEALIRDLDRARGALERSGLGTPTVELEYASDNPQSGIDQGTIAQIIQSNLAEVGITAELLPTPLATMLPKFRDGNVVMGLWTNNSLPDPSAFLVYCPGGTLGNRVNWDIGADPEIDALCEQAAVAGTDERVAVYQDLQRALNERGPFIPLFHPSQVFVTSNRLTNAVYNAALYVDLQNIGHSD